MTFKSSLFFALKLIFPKKSKSSSARRSVIGAILCIGISIIPLVVVMSVADGMISGMTKRIIGLSSCDLQAFFRKNLIADNGIEYLKDCANDLLLIQGVTQTYPVIECDALASGKTFRTGARIRAVEQDMFVRNRDFSELFSVCQGNLKYFEQNSKSCVVGQKLASLLNINSGDSIRLITSNSAKSGLITPKVSIFNVCAIVSSGYQELDALWVFIPIQEGFSFIPQSSANYSVMIKTENPFSTDLIKTKIECAKKLIGKATVASWSEINRSQFQNFSSTKVLLLFIMILIVLVAAINISSALVMLVMERKKEIAILKSIGATSSGITLSFLLAGVFCGIVGILIGLPLGILSSINSNELIYVTEGVINIVVKFMYALSGKSLDSFTRVVLMDPAYYLAEIPISIPFTELCLISMSVVLLSLVVSVIPAIKAGSENPIETFRKS